MAFLLSPLRQRFRLGSKQRVSLCYLAASVAGKNQAPLYNKLVSSAAFRFWTTFPIPTLQSFYANSKLGSRFSNRKQSAHASTMNHFCAYNKGPSDRPPITPHRPWIICWIVVPAGAGEGEVRHVHFVEIVLDRRIRRRSEAVEDAEHAILSDEPAGLPHVYVGL